MLRVLSFLRPNRFKYFISMLIDTAFTSICYNIVLAFIMKDVVNAIAYGNVLLLKRAVIIAIVSFLVAFIFQPIFKYINQSCVIKTMGKIKLATFKHMETLTVKNFEGRHTGDLITRMTNDVDAIQDLYMKHLSLLSFALIHGIVAIISMFYLNWLLAIIATGMGITSVLFSSLFRKPLRRVEEDVQERKGVMTERIIDVSDGIVETKMYNIEAKIFDKFAAVNQDLNKAVTKRGKITSIHSISNDTLGRLKTIGMLAFGLYMSIMGKVDIGTIAAILHLQGNASFLFENIGSFITLIQRSLVGAARVFALFSSPTESYSLLDRARSSGVSNQMIEMKVVSFSYENDKKVLNNINLSIAEGNMTAIVGTSGGGKSTILKLLMRFYDADNGEIYVNGKSIHSRTLRELRDLFAYVPQDAYLFMGTIEENISYGKIGASKEEIIEAAKRAYAHDFIVEFPNGYKTIVEEGSNNLSGGQKQRIAIARAILKNAPILLLDEATSALDSESEQLVQLAINCLMKGKTTLVIAHKLSTIEAADEIFVLKKGEIVEKGSHKELISMKGLYKNLYDFQFKC